MTPSLVLSGGQTGVDQAALRAAHRCGIPTGGWAPKGWRTEAGPMPSLAAYGMMEAQTTDYRERTRLNVELADAVLIIGQISAGSSLTRRLAARKPCLWLHPANLDVWDGADMEIFRYGSLLVAGNRESVSPGIGAAVEKWLVRAWSR